MRPAKSADGAMPESMIATPTPVPLMAPGFRLLAEPGAQAERGAKRADRHRLRRRVGSSGGCMAVRRSSLSVWTMWSRVIATAPCLAEVGDVCAADVRRDAVD